MTSAVTQLQREQDATHERIRRALQEAKEKACAAVEAWERRLDEMERRRRPSHARLPAVTVRLGDE